MSHDNRRERVVQDFLELTRKFPELSDPAYEKAITCIEECLGQVGRTKQQPLTRDMLQSQASEDIGGTVSGYSLGAPAHIQKVIFNPEEAGVDTLQDPGSIGRGSPSNPEHRSVEQTPQHVRAQDGALEQGFEQEQENEPGQQQRPLKRKSRADLDCPATEDENSGRMPRSQGQWSCNDKPPVRPTRQAARHAKESLSGHSASHSTMKRKRHHKVTPKDPKDFAWLESQLGHVTV